MENDIEVEVAIIFTMDREHHNPTLKVIEKGYHFLLEKLVPLFETNGGPIIAMQIETEYGSFGNDKKYLNYVKDSMIERGIDVLRHWDVICSVRYDF